MLYPMASRSVAGNGNCTSVVDYRNHIAHELLVNEAMLKCLLNGDSGRLEVRHLDKGIYELEQVLVLFNWCEEHDGW